MAIYLPKEYDENKRLSLLNARYLLNASGIAVLSGALLSGEARSSQLAPWLVCAPGQNRHAMQATPAWAPKLK